jgi:hypothetical protein
VRIASVHTSSTTVGTPSLVICRPSQPVVPIGNADPALSDHLPRIGPPGVWGGTGISRSARGIDVAHPCGTFDEFRIESLSKLEYGPAIKVHRRRPNYNVLSRPNVHHCAPKLPLRWELAITPGRILAVMEFSAEDLKDDIADRKCPDMRNRLPSVGKDRSRFHERSNLPLSVKASKPYSGAGR